MLCVAKGEVGERIRRALDAHPHMRAADLARALDVSPQRLNGWLAAEHDPPIDMLIPISEALGKSVGYLLALGEDISPISGTSRLTSSSKKMVRSFGEVPSDRPRLHNRGWLEVDLGDDINIEDCRVVTVKGSQYGPRFPEGRLLVIQSNRKILEGKFTLFLSPTRGLYMGVPYRDGKDWVVSDPNESDRQPLGDGSAQGYLVHEEQTDPDGIGPNT